MSTEDTPAARIGQMVTTVIVRQSYPAHTACRVDGVYRYDSELYCLSWFRSHKLDDVVRMRRHVFAHEISVQLLLILLYVTHIESCGLQVCFYTFGSMKISHVRGYETPVRIVVIILRSLLLT